MKNIVITAAIAAAMVVPMGCTVFADSEKEYRNDGYVLSVPQKYDPLLVVDTPEDVADGVLFVVYEKDSLEAAKAHGYDEEKGLGYLFSIETADEAAVREMRCGDMSGTEVFAVDKDGTYFLYKHPTDVRIEFADDADEDEAMGQFSMLNEWAYDDVRDDFVDDNAGLTEKEFGNTSLDIYFARIAYDGFTDYTVSTLEYGPLEPGDVSPESFLERLEGMSMEPTDDMFPDGEYTVFSVSGDNVRFDFAIAYDDDGDDDEDFVREVLTSDDGTEMEFVYKAELPDGRGHVTDAMNDWYQTLAENAEKK